MNLKRFRFALLGVCCSGALLLSSCVYEVPVYSTAAPYRPAAAAWTAASYDASGFPIYGYYYGRPVYGYTAEGVAVFTIGALTAACFVPLWGPAPWYHGHWHYPHHIHRVSAPPRFPAYHQPAHRPHGGLHAPIHHNPNPLLQAPRPPHQMRGPVVHRLPERSHAPAPQGGLHGAPHAAPHVGMPHSPVMHHGSMRPAAPQMGSPMRPAVSHAPMAAPAFRSHGGAPSSHSFGGGFRASHGGGTAHGFGGGHHGAPGGGHRR